MSTERHPNINATAFTSDIVESFIKYVRGAAKRYPDKSLEILKPRLSDFVAEISTDLDMELGAD